MKINFPITVSFIKLKYMKLKEYTHTLKEIFFNIIAEGLLKSMEMAPRDKEFQQTYYMACWWNAYCSEFHNIELEGNPNNKINRQNESNRQQRSKTGSA